MTRSRNILPPKRFWTAAEAEMLRARYPYEPTSDIARDLERDERAVYQKAYQLGLQKTPEYLASPEAGRLRANDTRGATTRFKAGQVPANKGLRRPGWAPGRMADNQFKKGAVPHTWQPVGTRRINAEGYLDRKITDEGPSYKRWERVHRLVWIEANGPIPAGQTVTFKPGRFTSDESLITLDALELVTRAELMRRNSFHRYPQPIPQLIQLRGVLQRQINKRAKRENENNRPA